MSESLWLKIKHPDKPGLFVSVRAEIEGGEHEIKSGRVVEELTGNDISDQRILKEFDSDTFLKAMEEYGFDENEIHFEFESVLDGLGREVL